MMLTRLSAPLRALRRFLPAALAVALVSTLVACGGGGYLPSPVSLSDKRPLSAEFLSRKAAAYSPYRTARTEAELGSEVITAANVLQDLRLVQGAGIGLIRLFSSNIFSETVLSTIRSNGLDLKVMLGAYVFRPDDGAGEARNQLELLKAIDLANRYSDIVLAVSVGNETMVDWSFLQIPPAVMGRYIKQVRDAVKQPVTTDDNWYFWATAPNVVLDVVDFAAVHTYPLLDTFYDPKLFEWRMRDVPAAQRAAAMMDASINEAKRQVGQARSYLDRIGLSDLPIVVGETGWMAVDYDGDPALPFRVSPANQKMYYERLLAWEAEPAAQRPPAKIFYFQSFDEQWKGSDDGWGLFTRDRKARCVVQAKQPESASWPYDKSQPCDAASALYFVPPVVTDPLPASTTRYVLFSDAAPASGDQAAVGQAFNAFGKQGGVTVSAPLTSATAAPGDGSQSIAITPTPADYGWGFFQNGPSVNLSGFAQGSLTFWIRTNAYPGKIEIGVWSDTDERNQAEAYLQIAPGQYGYCNNDTWCQVTIPVSAFVAANPALDLRLVTGGFVISDVYSRTGKPLNTTGLPPVYVDGIAWKR